MRLRDLRVLVFYCGAALAANSDNAAATGAGVGQLDASDPMSWLVKSVCTDPHDLVLPIDPYGGCPAGAGIRKIKSGDPLPYHNIEQIGYQRHDAFPVTNTVDDKTWIISTFDYVPFDRFNLFNGSDGYDIYVLQGRWAAVANTSDGGGYGQTFYGSDCNGGDGGWVLFPRADFLRNGSAMLPISDVYWEQTGQSYPGACPSSYSTNTQTSWQYEPRFHFGGVNGNPTKIMDTVISYHGFNPGPGFLRHGHLEIFYFTREYGITRWEVWVPTAQNPTATRECEVPATQTYQGGSFVVQACHDWSNATPASTPLLPVWPIPNINLLSKTHFDGTITPAWNSQGQSRGGNPMRWSVQNSISARDTRASPIGVRYLRLDCGAGSDGRCGAGISEAIYQDVPISRFRSGGSYAFGIDTRTESGKGEITLAIQQIDADGRVISTDRTASTAVLPDNGTQGRESEGEASSIYLSSSFVYGAVTIEPRTDTAKIRFLISPQTPQTFDVLDAWLAPWPIPAGFGTMP